MRLRLPAAALLITALLTGCGGSGSVSPLSKADGWRPGLERTLERTDRPTFAVIEVAYDHETAELAWDENVPDHLEPRRAFPESPGRYGDLADVDFERQVVVVWSSGQSGSCPGWLAEIRTKGQEVHITTDEASEADGFCTDDYNAYRMVLAVNRDRVPPAAQLPTYQVWIDGREPGRGAHSVVREYPG